MTLAERLARSPKLDRAARSVRILTIDVERFPAHTLSYDIWQTNIPKEWILEPPRISCFAAKWLGEKPVVIDERAGHLEMVTEMWKLLDEASIVVTYNGEKADIPWMNEEFKLAGLPLPATFKSVDLIKTNRKRFNLPSRSLQYFGEWLGKGGKLDSGGSQLVKKLVLGLGTERDWNQYRSYNRRDTELTEQIFLDLLPWLVDLPHIGMMSGDENQRRCYACASAQLDLLPKRRYAYVRMYELYRCARCGALNHMTGAVGLNHFTRQAK